MKTIHYTGMGYTAKQGRVAVAWLLLCGMVFAALSPVRAAALPTMGTSPAAAMPSQTQCRMASTPKPCCCAHHSAPETAKPATSGAAFAVVPVEQGACSCSVRPAPVAPNGTPEPNALVNNAPPLYGVVPATLLLASSLPRFARIAALRPAFSLGPPLRSPPRSADTGRAPPGFPS